MVSPRPNWDDPPSSTIEDPPSWRMARSKLTRVRVDFSEDHRQDAPSSGRSSSGLPFGWPARRCFLSIASFRIAAMGSRPRRTG
jgi:hypothetical protein